MTESSTSGTGPDLGRAGARRRWVVLATAHGFVLLMGFAYFKTAKLIDVVTQVRISWSVGPLAYAQDLALAVLWTVCLALAGVLVAHRKWLARPLLGLAAVLEIASFFYGMFNVHYFRLFGIPLNLEAISDVEKVGDFWSSILPYLTSVHTLVAGILSIVIIMLPFGLQIPRLERFFGTVGQRLTQRWGAPAAAAAAGATIAFVPIDEYELAKNDIVEMASSITRLALEGNESHAEFLGATNRPVESFSQPGVLIEPPRELRKFKKRIQKANAKKPMNVVVIVLESWVSPDVADHLGITEAMPYLGKLSKRSIVLEDYSTVFPLSMKSLISLTCSILPSPERQTLTKINPRLDCRSIGEVATERGYRAGLFHSGRFSFTMKDMYFEDRGFEVMLDADALEPTHPDLKSDVWGLAEEAAIESMFEWVDQNPEDPFLAVYVPLAGHHPYRPLNPRFRKYGNETDVDRYKNAVRYMDRMLRKTIKGFRERKLDKNTIFVIVGDHGLPLELHPNNDVQSAAVFEENVRTLGYIYQPRHIKETIRYPETVQHMDVLPSLYDLLGWEIPERYAGESIFSPYRKKMAIHYTLRSKKLASLRDGKLKAIIDLRNDTATVYDLARDPAERKNVADEHPEFVEFAIDFFDGFLPAHTAFIADYPVIKSQTELPEQLVARIEASPALATGRDEALSTVRELMPTDSNTAYLEAETLLLSVLKQDSMDSDALMLLMRVYDRLALLHRPRRYEHTPRTTDVTETRLIGELAQKIRATLRARGHGQEAESVVFWSTHAGGKADDRASRFLALHELAPEDPEIARLGVDLLGAARARRIITEAGVSIEDQLDTLAKHVAEHPEDWFAARILHFTYWKRLADPAAALAVCDSECALASGNLTQLLDVAGLYYGTGQYTHAAPLFERAATMAGASQMEIASAYIQTRLGAIALLTGDDAAAKQHFEAAAELDERRAIPRAGLAMLAMRSDVGLEEAEELVDEAKKGTRGGPWKWAARAELEERQGEPARPAYAKAGTFRLLALDAEFHAATAKGDHARAERVLRKLVQDFTYDELRFAEYARRAATLKDRHRKSTLPTTADGLRKLNAAHREGLDAFQAAKKAEQFGLTRRAVQIANAYLDQHPKGSQSTPMRNLAKRVEDGPVRLAGAKAAGPEPEPDDPELEEDEDEDDVH